MEVVVVQPTALAAVDTAFFGPLAAPPNRDRGAAATAVGNAALLLDVHVEELGRQPRR